MVGSTEQLITPPELPKRVRGTYATIGEPSGAYDEKTIELAFTQAGFANTAAVAEPKHRIENHDPSKAVRMTTRPGDIPKEGAIASAVELGNALMARRERPHTTGGSPERANPEARLEWGQVDRPITSSLGQQALATMHWARLADHIPFTPEQPEVKVPTAQRTFLPTWLGSLLRRFGLG